MNNINYISDKFPSKSSFRKEVSDDDRDILELKNRVKNKKGRGFQTSSSRENECGNNYDRVKHTADKDDDDEEDNFPQRSVEGWILFVANLHEEIQEEDIMDKFGDFGPIKNMHLNLDRRTGFVKGYCLVEYETYREALIAKEAMHNAKILGQTILVDWAFVKNPRRIDMFELTKKRRNRKH